jgi:hypothetical protein
MQSQTDPRRLHAVTPYLIVAGAAQAIAFYKQVFGATDRCGWP